MTCFSQEQPTTSTFLSEICTAPPSPPHQQATKRTRFFETFPEFLWSWRLSRNLTLGLSLYWASWRFHSRHLTRPTEKSFAQSTEPGPSKKGISTLVIIYPSRLIAQLHFFHPFRCCGTHHQTCVVFCFRGGEACRIQGCVRNCSGGPLFEPETQSNIKLALLSCLTGVTEPQTHTTSCK